MNAPCGHKQAVCVIGNFWTCSICDKQAISDAAGRPFTRGYIGEWIPTPLHTTWSPGLGGVGALSKVVQTAIAANPLQRYFPPHVQIVADRSLNEPERKKAYTALKIETNLVSPWEFVAVQREVDSAIDRHNDYVASEIYRLAEPFRGGPWHVSCLGQPVHVIEDAGVAAVLCTTSDAYEIRLRSFYHVCEGAPK
jgi:hypothetical protein